MQPDQGIVRPKRLTRLITRVPLLLAKRLWVWPLVGAVVIGAVGFWVRARVEETTRAELATRLQTLLNADVAALRLWFSEREADAESLATDLRVESNIRELAALADTPGINFQRLANAPQATTLQQVLKPVLEAQHYLDYVILSPDKRVIGAPRRFLINRPAPPAYDMFLEKALKGEIAVSQPLARELPSGQHPEGPNMFVAAPVRADDGKVVAVLALRMRPEAEFSRIFSVARMGESGEAYAFDRKGMMLTASRFDPELKKLGLIPDVSDSTTILNLRLLDPEMELAPGIASGKHREELSLTRMAASATRGRDGYDVRGYRNYRGVSVVGAWAWLSQYSMGVATEVAADEAFSTLYMLRRVFLLMFVLLILCGGAIFAFTLLVERLEASVRKSSLTARRLGQYVLVQEIGRGADGMVYRARHALLRRPVAVKLLSPDITNESNAARFEHEVQMTSQLTHPNTVAIYDYGRTPEGLFYYAMEYLGGIDLHRLCREFGPQPEGRIVHLLRQVCGSLAEAHRIGLIHRDIKPANIIVTRRGGLYDVAKVVDFGVVKTVRAGRQDGPLTDEIVGTPHYMPPEAITDPHSVDGRSDIYSTGAVGYWLLTGKTLFEDDSVDGLLDKQVKVMPPKPSSRTARTISADLEELIMRCLSKAKDERPRTAEDLDAALAACQANGAWTSERAEAWWAENLRALEAPATRAMAEKTLVIAPRS